MDKVPEPTQEENTETTSARRPATVVVKAPLDVKVRFNGQLVRRTATEQKFVTPRLKPGRTYSYQIEAEATRDGEKVTRAEKIVVQPGRLARVDFNEMTARTTKPARVTVMLPADAKLFIDGTPCPLTSEKRSFSTPKLQVGRSYFYTLKTEVVRDGETLTDSRRVNVRAGENVKVEFTDLPARTQAARR